MVSERMSTYQPVDRHLHMPMQRQRVKPAAIAAAVDEETKAAAASVDARMQKRAGISGRLRQLYVRDLVQKPGYQRELKASKVKEIMENFDPDLVQVIIVSYRGGSYWIVDGQHRIEALRRMEWDDQLVPCLVYEGLTIAQEAKIFEKPQSSRRPLRPAEKFSAKLLQNDPAALAIKSIVEDYGYALGLGTGTNRNHTHEIDAIGSLEQVYRGYREPVLAMVLQLTSAAWGTDVKVSGTMISGIAAFLHEYRKQTVDIKRLVNVLRANAPVRIETEGKEVSQLLGFRREDGVAYQLYKLYNHKLQTNRLPAWKGHTK